MRHSIEHEHGNCVRGALEQAEAICAKFNLRLTALRRRVLELLLQEHTPLKAYTLLDTLKLEMPSAKPATVYRALDFLLEHDLIHKLDSQNAYIGCFHPAEPHAGYFLICKECTTVSEVVSPTLEKEIHKTLGRNKFKASSITLEISGLCENCALVS